MTYYFYEILWDLKAIENKSNLQYAIKTIKNDKTSWMLDLRSYVFIQVFPANRPSLLFVCSSFLNHPKLRHIKCFEDV